MTMWGPPNESVLSPEEPGNRNQVGIGIDPKDGTLFPYTICCRMKFFWKKVVDPVEMYWACEKCGRPFRHVAAGASTSIDLHESQHNLRVFVSKWIGRSMHDIRVDVYP
jgi:hypothetical protein